MKQIKIKCSFKYSSPRKEWVDVVKYHERKQYGSIWFKPILNQMEIKEDRGEYPDSIYFFIGNDVVMEQDEKYEYLWVDYSKIWSFFHSEFNYNYQKIRELIRGMVESHFKMKAFPTVQSQDNHQLQVESHFKMKAFPTKNDSLFGYDGVESHFKMKAFPT